MTCRCLLCVCRFLQLELSEMEAFVNQHKSKVIKRQVIPFLFVIALSRCLHFLNCACSYADRCMCVHMGVQGRGCLRCHP